MSTLPLNQHVNQSLAAALLDSLSLFFPLPFWFISLQLTRLMALDSENSSGTNMVDECYLEGLLWMVAQISNYCVL